jgi:steroid delta-isomerase-like uncharacterized protein
MTVEQNKELVRRFYEQAWNLGETDVAFEIFADDYVRHDPRGTEALPGPAGQKKIADDFRAAFPDLEFTVDFLIGEGDFVVGRWTATGTHTGAWGGREPTGRRATLTAVNIFRFDDGKVAELWNHRDDLGLAEQLGVPVHGGAAPDERD